MIVTAEYFCLDSSDHRFLFLQGFTKVSSLHSTLYNTTYVRLSNKKEKKCCFSKTVFLFKKKQSKKNDDKTFDSIIFKILKNIKNIKKHTISIKNILNNDFKALKNYFYNKKILK